MILKLDIERVRTIDEVRDFMTGSEPVDFHLTDRRGAYDFVTRTLRRLNYAGLSKADKGVVRRFVAKVTGLSRAQSTRLIGQYQNTGHIRDRRCGATRPFERRYTAVDIRLLAEVDETLGGLCGPTTRRVMRRQYEVFGDERFERLAGLSNSHLYRMRQSTTYRRRRNPTTKTQATQVSIGERRKPHPQGRPGFLRVDSVHQGDLDGRKGVYEVNLVDEVTQYEFVAAVEGISERFLVPALEALIEAFPFEIKGFHADNGSEYINYRVVRLLRKLHVEEFTKSRPRRSNDNALVESKNASVVRRHLGHAHIARRHAALVNGFLRDVLAPYLNYHRPCHFPVETTDSKGRTRKRYPFENVTTPYLKLKSLDSASAIFAPVSPSSSSTASLWRSTTSPPHDSSTRPATNCFATSSAVRPRRHERIVHRAESSGSQPHDKGRILWICGRVLRTGASPAGRVDSPWTTRTRCPPPAHTLAPLAHKLHRTNHR